MNDSKLVIDTMETPLGLMSLVTDAQGILRALDWADYEARMHELLRRHQRIEAFDLSPGNAPAALKQAMQAYFDGKITAIDHIETAPGGTTFQRQVWSELRRIPYGQTISYGELASRIGRPSASRAVGAANGANPIGIVVPCHRVIGANKSLTGYGGGLERKRWLLDHERKCYESSGRNA
jgi:methylated-DNA-[protein]-cysteine S-methyltransferase